MEIYRVAVRGNVAASGNVEAPMDACWYFVTEGAHAAVCAAQVVLESDHLPVYIHQVGRVEIDEVPEGIREAVQADLESENHDPPLRSVDAVSNLNEAVHAALAELGGDKESTEEFAVVYSERGVPFAEGPYSEALARTKESLRGGFIVKRTVTVTHGPWVPIDPSE